MDGWTLRLAAAALLTLCGAAGGHSLAAARKLRVTQLESLVEAMARLEVQMLERMLPLNEALASCGDSALKKVGECMTGARSALDAWLGATDALRARGAALCALESEDLDALDRLFEGLGATGASEQRLLLGRAHAELERLTQAARKKAEEQAKLYTSLGLIAGLALAVCLL